MLAMTRKILQSLHDNEAQLQDIDYADGFADCVRRVYRRPGLRHRRWRPEGYMGLFTYDTSETESDDCSENDESDSSWSTVSEHTVDSSDVSAKPAEERKCRKVRY